MDHKIDEKAQVTGTAPPVVQTRTALVYIVLALLILIPGLLLRSNIDTIALKRALSFVAFGSGLRFWLGALGALLIALLFLYPLRKVLARRKPWLSVRIWYHLHMALGIVGAVMLVYHANFGISANDVTANVALFSILTIALSGIVGQFVYTRASVDFYATRRGVLAHLDKLGSDIKALEASEPATKALVSRLEECGQQLPTSRLGLIETVRNSYKLAIQHHQLYREMNALLADARQRFSWPQEEYRRQRREIGASLAASFSIARKATRESIFEQLWGHWRLFHVPMLVLATLSAGAHVWLSWQKPRVAIPRLAMPIFAGDPTNKPTQLYTPEEAIAALDRLNKSAVKSGQSFFEGANYVGSASCKECHKAQDHEWANTWHAKMYRTPNQPGTQGSFNIVVGAFDGVPIEFPNIEVDAEDGKSKGRVTFRVVPTTAHPQTAAPGYFFTVKSTTNSSDDQTFQVAIVIGGNLEQAYHIKAGEHYFPAPLRWKVGGRGVGAWQNDSTPQPENWIYASGKPRIQTQLSLRRTAEAQCMGCHTTGYRFELREQGGRPAWTMIGNSVANGVDTNGVLGVPVRGAVGTGAELGIGCESCHGPGSSHNAAQSDTGGKAPDVPKPLVPGRIINPLKHLTQTQQSMLCGQCHARGTNQSTPGFERVPLEFPHTLPPPRNTPPGKAVVADRGFMPGDVDLPLRFRLAAGHGANPQSFWPNDLAKRGRMQWQDHAKSPHAATNTASCLTCHSGHAPMSKRFDNDRFQLRPSAGLRDGTDKAETQCESCHKSTGSALQPNKEMYAGSPMHRAGVTCVNCHMSQIGNRIGRTTLTPKTGSTGDGTFDATPGSNYGKHWDVSSHTSRVASTSDSADVAPGIGTRTSCISCHSETPANPPGRPQTDKEFDDLFACRKDIVRTRLKTLQTRMQSVDTLIKAGGNALARPGLSLQASRERALSQLDRARAQVQFVVADRSWGAHNWKKTINALQAADAELSQACGTDPSCKATTVISTSQSCIDIDPDAPLKSAVPTPAAPAPLAVVSKAQPTAPAAVPPVQVQAAQPQYKAGQEIRFQLKVQKLSHLYCYLEDSQTGDMQIVLPAPSARSRIATPADTAGHVLKGDDFDLAGPYQAGRPGQFSLVCFALDESLPEAQHRQWLAHHVADGLTQLQYRGIPADDPRAGQYLVVPPAMRPQLLDALKSAGGKETRARVTVVP